MFTYDLELQELPALLAQELPPEQSSKRVSQSNCLYIVKKDGLQES